MTDSIPRPDTVAAVYRLKFLLALGCLQTSYHCLSDIQGAAPSLPLQTLPLRPEVIIPKSLCTMAGQSQALNFHDPNPLTLKQQIPQGC